MEYFEDLEIERSGGRAIVWNRGESERDLTEAQRKENKVSLGDRILIVSFFARWKSLFEMCQELYRGSLKQLNRVMHFANRVMHWYISRHPLRLSEEEKAGASGENTRTRPGQVIELDASTSDDKDQTIT
jgi:hypothetical protein